MRSKCKMAVLLLQISLLAVLVFHSPAVGQSNEGTTTGTETTQSTYNAEEVQVRKDAWTWYWDEKAHLDTNNSTGFWGDDAVSNLFKNVCNSVLVPLWNAAMEYDFVRAGVLLVVAGMLLGLGASVFLKKSEKEKPQ